MRQKTHAKYLFLIGCRTLNGRTDSKRGKLINMNAGVIADK
jgi:hypothetical protein